MGDSAPLAKLWFQIPNTAALLICKYGTTNANSSSGRKKKKKLSSFLGFICQKSLLGEIAKCCTFCLWPKGNYCQKAFDSFWLYDVFQKKKKKTAQISHHMLSIPQLQLGASEEILTFMRTTSLNPPPSLSPTAGFISSAGTMTAEEKGMLSPLTGQHWKTFTLMRHF